MIELEGVSKRFGDLVALHPTDLLIDKGVTSALIGPSGCGKSTILRLFVGLLEPTSGTIRIGGQRLGPDNLQAMRRRMGYVIQEGGLFPHLSARENVTIMSRHLGVPAGEAEQRLDELLDLTHFPRERLDRFPLELSGGQRQRVALMRALMLDPDVLLLDEPLGALDPMVRHSLQSELKEIFAKLGKTVVLVTHDMAEATYLAGQIVLLREGRIVQRGTLQQFREEPEDEFVTRFLNAQRSLVQL